MSKKGLLLLELMLRTSVLIQSIQSHLVPSSVLGHFMQIQICSILEGLQGIGFGVDVGVCACVSVTVPLIYNL